ARETVAAINSSSTSSANGTDFIICICESGTGGEDRTKKLEKKIASSVDGIDLIVSTGSSTSITKPITVNGTRIVSLPDDGKSVLSVVYSNTAPGTSHDSFSFSSCNIKKISSYKMQKSAKSAIDKYHKLLNSSYFSRYGFSYNTALSTAYFTINPVDYDLKEHEDSATGELIADAYRYSAIHDADLSSGNLITAASSGSMEGSISRGKVTPLDLYTVMGSGKSKDGTSGQALVEFYLNGNEIEKIAEKAALTAGVSGKTQLCFGGLTYKYNPKRGDNYALYDLAMRSEGSESGMGSKIRDDKLYRIVTDKTTADYICSMKYKNDADGSTEKVIPKDRQGVETSSYTEVPAVSTMKSIKCWQAMASYFKSFPSTGVPAVYKKADSRFTYSTDGSLMTLLRGQAGSLIVFLIVILIGILALITLIWLIRGTVESRRERKKRNKA
ncbi:MAG: 5'-nucleotidase C-terminal domain-containing protein, partial [Anaerovoracaceae bacterium]